MSTWGGGRLAIRPDDAEANAFGARAFSGDAYFRRFCDRLWDSKMDPPGARMVGAGRVTTRRDTWTHAHSTRHKAAYSGDFRRHRGTRSPAGSERGREADLSS